MSKSMRALVRDIGPNEVLAAADLEAAELAPRHGWSNRTWIGDEVVVRISSGRLEGSFAHERHVIDLVAPVGMPVARVLACGRVNDLPRRAGEAGEWMVSRRLPGDTLAALWCDLVRDDRARIGHEIGGLMRRLHHVDTTDIAPPWWLQAHHPPLLRNAYRARVELGPTLVEAA